MHDGTFVKSLAFSFDLVYDDFEILPDGKFLCHDIQGRKGESKIWVMSEKGEKEQTLLYHDAVFHLVILIGVRLLFDGEIIR